jgi:hypothetical protein
LVLCAQQARAGRNKPFSYSVPKLIKATGLCERAVGMALGALEKRRLIERQKNPGPTGNRYRIIWGPPAATNGEPIPASTYEPVSAKTDAPVPEEAARVAAETPPARAGSHSPEKPLPDPIRPVEVIDSHEPKPPAATNKEPIRARKAKLMVRAPNLLEGYPEDLDVAAPEPLPARPRGPKKPRKEQKEPLPYVGTSELF